MKQETTIGKAFEINKDPGIYGTFAEIGAGQETVNFFYKAGLASQTVAKSMSAYDMTISDEIYGKQNRYVCKERLLTMLEREYSLLKSRLKGRLGGKSRFFAFAVTAAIRAVDLKKNYSPPHAWMGLRFQVEPGEAFNDIIFHLNCGDRDRLQQHSALGILGVNLIYSAFHCGGEPKKLISFLKENLSLSRIDIQGMSCSGPAFKKGSPGLISLQLLSENLSSMAFFSKEGKSEFLSDAVFNKYPVLLYGDQVLKKSLNKPLFLKSLSLKAKQTVFISFISAKELKASSLPSQLEKFFKNQNSVLITSGFSLEELSQKINLYDMGPAVYIVSEDHFIKMFDPGKQFLLKSFGQILSDRAKVAVLPKNKGFSVRTCLLKSPQEQILKNYLVTKKYIVDAYPSV